MSLLITVIDILLILLLLRLLIKPNEAFFDPIYRLIYRITDPLLIISGYISRSINGRVFLSLAALILLRGILYGSVQPLSIRTGVGMSLLGFFSLLFQAYFVLWLISVLSDFRTPFDAIINRALHPFNRLSWRFRIRRKYYSSFVLFVFFGSYIILSALTRFLFLQGSGLAVLPAGLLEGFLLILSLFPFPGFFSLVIIIGALLSWVSPDPSNSIVRAIYGITEPLLQPFRRFIPNLGGLDISPIIALLCFQFIGALGQQIIANIMRI